MSDRDDEALAALEAAFCASDHWNPLHCGECDGRGVELGSDGIADDCPHCDGSGKSDYAITIRAALKQRQVPAITERQLRDALNILSIDNKLATPDYELSAALFAAAPKPEDDDA